MKSKKHKLIKRSIQKEDGRVLIFYDFECNEGCTAGISVNVSGYSSEETRSSAAKKPNRESSAKTEDSSCEESHGKILE